tara:strand:- start:195 stop:557 length:363 start_codon:yes stop_codon:yes gene_type:complete
MSVNKREREKIVILSVRKCLFTGFWRWEEYGVLTSAPVQEYILCSAQFDTQAGESHRVSLGSWHGEAEEGRSIGSSVPGNQRLGRGICPSAKIRGKFYPDGGIIRCATGKKGKGREVLHY